MNRDCKPLFYVLLFLSGATAIAAEWETVETQGEPYKRHEAAFIEFEDKFYLLGGRRVQPVSIYDTATGAWTVGAIPPVEVHHFQPVVFGDRIYFICAMTGPYPNETGLPQVLTYAPKGDRWEFTHEIPESRRRGSAGAVVFNDKIYLACGIVRGHVGGFVNWFDEYDPTTGAWRTLPNAPRPRDHFQGALLDGKLYAAGGRTTSKETNQTFELTVNEVDVYDFAKGKWTSLPDPLPTPRAGNSTMTLGREIWVIGGESGKQKAAHDEVEAWHVDEVRWKTLSPLQRGRHGTGAFLWGNHVYTCSGCGNRGGSPELTSLERIIVE